jgi:hypothetical protein
MRMVGFLAPALATAAGQPRLENAPGTGSVRNEAATFGYPRRRRVERRVTASCENSRASLLRSRWLNALMWGILVRRNRRPQKMEMRQRIHSHVKGKGPLGYEHRQRVSTL